MFSIKSLLWIFCILPLVVSKAQSHQNVMVLEKIQSNIDIIKKKFEELKTNSEYDEFINRMIDSWSKLPNSGLLTGAFVDLGNFDECYNLEYQDLFGKYCIVEVPFPTPESPSRNSIHFNKSISQQEPNLQPVPDVGDSHPYSNFMGFHFAICIPSNMSVPELTPFLSESFCYSKANLPEYTAGAIVMIMVFAIFACIIIASTIYDLMLHYRNQEPKHELLIAFSCFTNGRKIITATKNSDQLLCLNGIKAISMMWVILGHEYSCMGVAPITNILETLDWMNSPKNMFVSGASVSVDSFFVVGGLVTVYTFMKSMDKGVPFNIFLYYLHRYLRLTPAYLMMCLFNMYLIVYVSYGPLWSVMDTTATQVCLKSWWSSILYITNYVQEGVCLPQAWYLSVDMQLFILSPFVLLTLRISEKFGLWLLGILGIAGCVVPFAISYTEQMTSTSSLEYGNLYYNQTHARFGPYVIGMALGYFIYKFKKGNLRVKLHPLLVVGLWLVILAGLFATVWGGYPFTLTTAQDVWAFALYLAFNRPGWAVCLCGVIFMCVTNYGGPVNWFLSLEIFQFLTKLSYSMYLVHATVIISRLTTLRTTFTFSDFQMMHNFWGDFMLTLIMSLVLTLSFESPVIILEKYLFGMCGTKKPKDRVKTEPTVIVAK